MIECYVFDLDGTLANIDHRLPLITGETKNWDAFFDACDGDAPIGHMIELCETLARNKDIVIFSGRSERCRLKTLTWLKDQRVPVGTGFLFMRDDGDHRHDHVVKLDMLAVLRNGGYKPIMAFEDRSSVVKMWRKAGIPCCQVAEGDF